MPIKKLTPPANIDKFVEGEIEKLKNALAYNLGAIGEQVVNEARISGSYEDQSGNLRSSVGFVIAIDGEIVQCSSFEVVKNGKEGAEKGKAYAMSLVERFPNCTVLIVVAGMHYASYVHAKGKNVLESSELLAKKLISELSKKLD